jgi:AhpD family alkylhydroperoxidase
VETPQGLPRCLVAAVRGCDTLALSHAQLATRMGTDVARDLAELAAIGRSHGDVENAFRFEEEARAVLAAGKAQMVATNSTNEHE